MDVPITTIGKTNGRHPHKYFGIKQPDRLSHIYVIGKTGTGKSTLLENLIHHDLVHGGGLCLIDPHGDLVKCVYDNVPEHRKDDVLYFNVPRRTQRKRRVSIGRYPEMGLADARASRPK